MELLVYLAQHAGKTIGKLELQKKIWPDQEVTDAALTRIISQLRRCLSDQPKSPNYIMTIKNTGYRLIATVSPKNYFTDNQQTNCSPENPSNTKTIYINSLKLIVIILLSLSLALIYNYAPRSSKKLISRQYLTTDKGEEMAPALSPNGEMVVYKKTIFSENNRTKNGALFLKSINDNTVVRLTYIEGSSAHPSWSPDNRQIAFAHETTLANSKVVFEIYIIDIQTKKVSLLSKTSSHSHGLSWSEDGRFLIFPDGSNQNKVNSLVKLEISTGRKEYIIEPIDSHVVYGYPSYSPDNRQIAVIRTDQTIYESIDLIDVGTNKTRNILSHLQDISGLTWKDNDTLFIVYGSIASSRILEYSIPSGEYEELDIKDNNIEYLSYSQNTERLVFESIQTPYNIWYSSFSENHTLPLDFKAFTNSSRQELEALESPDGHYTALISSRSGAFEIWLRESLSGQSQKLTTLNADMINGLDWSPQSDKLAFVATINSKTALYWVTPHNSKLHRFSHGENQYSLVGWEAQGSSLLFGSNFNGQWKLWRLYTDSNKVEVVSDEPIAQGRLTPDREMLFFIKHKHPGIWKADLINKSSALVPNTESISVFRGWTVSEKGIYYLLYGNVGKRDEIYFLDFNKSQPALVARIVGLHMNRIYWSNNNLYYCVYDARNSDIAMIEGI